MGVVTDPIDTLIELTREKRGLDARINILKKEIKACSRVLLQEWTAAGTQNMKRNGATVYMLRGLKVTVIDDEALSRALEGILPGKVHRGQLCSHMKELLQDPVIGEWRAENSRIPEELQGIVEVDEFFDIKVLNAG